MTERDCATLGVINPNLEIRNPKQIQILQIPMKETGNTLAECSGCDERNTGF